MTGLTITSSSNSGYDLNTTADNPVSVASGVTITSSNFPAIGTTISSYWTIVNSGTLLASGRNSASDGILLADSGGSVTNTNVGSVTGYYAGISLQGAGTVVNQGTIVSTGTSGTGYIYTNQGFTSTSAGVLLGGGGVSNAGAGVISGYFEGVAVGGGGSVVNAGTIVSLATQHGFGVVLAAGGNVANAQSGVISGYDYGVLALGQPATIINQGYIGGRYGIGVDLLDGGVVSNTSAGAIYGYSEGVRSAGAGALTVTNAAGGIIAGGLLGIIAEGTGSATVTLTNAGLIVGYKRIGAVLLSSGSIYNAMSGRIHGLTDGIYTGKTAAATITNAGSIYGNNFAGVVMADGGDLTNTGSLSGLYYGVSVLGNAGTVVNAGSISVSAVFKSTDTAFASAGIQLADGGQAINSTHGVITSKWIGIQVYRAAGTVINQGSISAAADGIFTSGSVASTVVNDGIVSSSGYTGAWLQSGGGFTNAGTISGYYFGVKVSNAIGSVVNTGSISDSKYLNGAGVQLADGGVVTNAAGGHITSEWMGVQIGSALTSSVGGTVINQGTILANDVRGDGAGVWIHGPGAISNASGGLISGGAFAIVAYYQTTVVNQGTIFGTEYAFEAVHSGFADRVVDLPGGVFSGVVSGGNTIGSAIYSTLELASGSSTGTIVNVGSFTDFGRIALDSQATWSLGGTIVSGETVAFGGAHASLILASPSASAGTMAGFAPTDTIVLSGITDVTKLSFDGDTLVVTESGDAGLTLQFAAPVDLNYAVVNGSTDLFVPCFLPGTHILTDEGEVLVEKLRVGDSILTQSGRTRRLCWIGRGRSLATRGRRGPSTPVIVRKGALGDNVPHLDLHVTKGHSLYLGGVLIPVEFLVNHRSILWDDRAQEVTVFHLELDAHDVLVANGAAAESYRDDGNRWLFENANAGWDQPPQAPCAPVMTGGPLVDAIWQQILDRAGPRPGLPLTDDPDLHLVVDGVRVDAAERQGAVHVFRLKRRPETVTIASREAVPAELGLARDARSLGVALRSVAVRQGTKFTVLAARDVRLATGFHAYEAARDQRWTDGCATLPAEAFAPFAGGMEVVLDVAATTRYPHAGAGGVRSAA